MDTDTFSSTLKSVGAGLLTFVLLGGIGYYVYTELFTPPGPSATNEYVAVHRAAPAAPADKNAPVNERTPS